MKYLYKHDIEERPAQRDIRLGCLTYILIVGAAFGLGIFLLASIFFFAKQPMSLFKPLPQLFLFFALFVLWVWSPFESKRLRIRISPSWLFIMYYGPPHNRDLLPRLRAIRLKKIAGVERISFPEFFAHSFLYADKRELYLNCRLNNEDYDCVVVGSPTDFSKLKEGIAVKIANALGQKVIFESDDVENCIVVLKNLTGLP